MPNGHGSLVFGGKPSSVPYCTLAVTNKCNYACTYCCPDAENHGFGQGQPIEVGEMLEVAAAFYRQGVHIFRITGGEPTIWPQLEELIAGLTALGPDVWINLNSNASVPQVLIPLLAKYGRQMTLRVSIDRTSPSRHTPKYMSPRVRQTLLEARRFVPIRVNTVITDENLVELKELIMVCREIGADMKLLDLYYNRDYLSGEDQNTYWKRHFVPVLNRTHELLEQMGFIALEQYDDGGYGIPLPLFSDGSITISVKDSTLGTREHPSCKECPEYPCQEGFYSPMLSFHGVLHVSECRYQPFMFNLAGASLEEKDKAVDKILELFSMRIRRSDPPPLVKDYLAEHSISG